MRQLTTLPREQARLLADHLLTLNIATQLDDEAAGTAIWIRDEDHLDRARQELSEFQKNPADPRYREAGPQARAIRAREQQADTEYERRQRSFSDRMSGPDGPYRIGPWTVVLMVLCIGVSLVTQFGKDRKSPLLQAMWLVPVTKDGEGWFPDDGLAAITQRGEVWRIISPIFLHLSPWHLLFNMLALATLGGALERRIGSGAFLGLVVLFAVPSNLAEFYFGFTLSNGFTWELHPLFGGMSGVIYGLFGFLWVRSWKAEIPDAVLSPQSVRIMLIWLVLCMTGALGSIANTAHLVGLLVGMGIGGLANAFGK